VVDQALVDLDRRRVLFVDEVQRHLLRDLGRGIDTLEVDVQHDGAERVHLVVAQQTCSVLPASSISSTDEWKASFFSAKNSAL
jgi:hypothetical protein